MTDTAKDETQLASGGAVLAGSLPSFKDKAMHPRHSLQLFSAKTDFIRFF